MSFGCDKSDYFVPLEWVQEIADARGDPARTGGSAALRPGYEKVWVLVCRGILGIGRRPVLEII